MLERLAALSEQQGQALDRGDLALLAELTDLRGATVRDAAADLPPRTPWEPELAALASQVRERAARLEQSLHACMAVVRRDIATLDQRRRTMR